MLSSPEFGFRSCADCRKYVYNEDGSIARRGENREIPVLRLPMQPTPCEKCPKIPEGLAKIHQNAMELSERNRRAFDHYLECRAVGMFPDDEIVRRNAANIRQAHDDHDRFLMSLLIARTGSKNV